MKKPFLIYAASSMLASVACSSMSAIADAVRRLRQDLGICDPNRLVRNPQKIDNSNAVPVDSRSVFIETRPAQQINIMLPGPSIGAHNFASRRKRFRRHGVTPKGGVKCLRYQKRRTSKLNSLSKDHCHCGPICQTRLHIKVLARNARSIPKNLCKAFRSERFRSGFISVRT